MKNKNSSTEKISKNELFKNRIIISPEDLKEKFSSMNSIETGLFSDLFDANKFKIRNDFDRKHSKEFLKEKDECLQAINLNDTLSENDDDENNEVLNNISTKFTFGRR